MTTDFSERQGDMTEHENSRFLFTVDDHVVSNIERTAAGDPLPAAHHRLLVPAYEVDQPAHRTREPGARQTDHLARQLRHRQRVRLRPVLGEV